MSAPYRHVPPAPGRGPSAAKTINPPLAIAIVVVVLLAITTLIVVLTSDPDPGVGATGPSPSSSQYSTTTEPSAPSSTSAAESSSAAATGSTYPNGYPVTSSKDGAGGFAGDPLGSPPGWKRMSATGLGLSFDFPADFEVPEYLVIGDATTSTTANAKELNLLAAVTTGECGDGDKAPATAIAGLQYLDTKDPKAGLLDVLKRYAPVVWAGTAAKSATPSTPVTMTSKGGADGLFAKVEVTLGKGSCGTTKAEAVAISVVSNKTGETFVFLVAYRLDGDLAGAPPQTDYAAMLDSIRQLT